MGEDHKVYCFCLCLMLTAFRLFNDANSTQIPYIAKYALVVEWWVNKEVAAASRGIF